MKLVLYDLVTVRSAYNEQLYNEFSLIAKIFPGTDFFQIV